MLKYFEHLKTFSIYFHMPSASSWGKTLVIEWEGTRIPFGLASNGGHWIQEMCLASGLLLGEGHLQWVPGFDNKKNRGDVWMTIVGVLKRNNWSGSFHCRYIFVDVAQWRKLKTQKYFDKSLLRDKNHKRENILMKCLQTFLCHLTFVVGPRQQKVNVKFVQVKISRTTI